MEYSIESAFEAAVERWKNGEQIAVDNPIREVSPDTLRGRVLRGWQVPPCPERIEQIYKNRQSKRVGEIAAIEAAIAPSDHYMENKWATRMD